MLKKYLSIIIFILPFSFVYSQSKKLVWADEFNKNGLPDSTKWGYDHGGSGWGNNELQFYTTKRKENASARNGQLVIEARKENFDNRKYTSARLVSKNKGDWKYGRIEVKAKLPKGRGIWPAIWMLPTRSVHGGWPKSGEIDIMEFVGYMPDSVFGSVHTGSYNHTIGTQRTKGIVLKDLATAFHVYAIDWTEEKISFLIDDKIYYEFRNEGSGPGAWPFDQPFHIILNIAVGGNWGGKYGVDDAIFPQTMEIDYVRVYQ
jgi:beta-glucanase (GH16 family)